MRDALNNRVEMGIVDEAAISISHVGARHVMRSHEKESSQVQVHFQVTELNDSNVGWKRRCCHPSQACSPVGVDEDQPLKHG